MGSFCEVWNSNRLFLKLNRLMCNQQSVLPVHFNLQLDSEWLSYTEWSGVDGMGDELLRECKATSIHVIKVRGVDRRVTLCFCKGGWAWHLLLTWSAQSEQWAPVILMWLLYKSK